MERGKLLSFCILGCSLKRVSTTVQYKDIELEPISFNPTSGSSIMDISISSEISGDAVLLGTLNKNMVVFHQSNNSVNINRQIDNLIDAPHTSDEITFRFRLLSLKGNVAYFHNLSIEIKEFIKHMAKENRNE